MAAADANAMSVEVETQGTDAQLLQKIESLKDEPAKEPVADGNHAVDAPAADAPAAEPQPAADGDKKPEEPAAGEKQPADENEKKEEASKEECKKKCKKDKPADATKLGCAGGFRKLFSFGKKGKKANKPLDPPPAAPVCGALVASLLPVVPPPPRPLPLPRPRLRRHLVRHFF